MTFSNPLLLFGLAAVAIPVVIHLMTRHRAERTPWGAMQFLVGSFGGRNRRMLLEEALLLVARCLLVALLALALALPLVRAGGGVAARLLVPGVLAAAAAFGAGTALASLPRWRWGLFALAGAILAASLGGTAWRLWHGGPATPTAGREVAIVLDGSPSMRLVRDKTTNFERARAVARELVAAMPAGGRASVFVAGGPTRGLARWPSPRADELDAALAAAEPGSDRLPAAEALAAAAASFPEDATGDRTVVLIGDAQRAGWGEREGVDWPAVAAALGNAGPDTSLVVHRLGVPEPLGNLQVASVRVPADVIAPHRGVTVAVRVANTGTADAAADRELALAVDGLVVARQRLPALAAGTDTTVEFRHAFMGGGLHGIEARLAAGDDFAWDDRAAEVVRVFERLPVLLVEGNPTPRFLDRAGAFIDVALSPGGAGGDVGGAAGMFDVSTIDLAAVAELHDFSGWRAVILCDVPRLPPRAAAALARFVEEGGGLLIVPGGRSEPEFYAGWQTDAATAVPPARLTERLLRRGDEPARGIALETLEHPALRGLADGAVADLDAAVIAAHWKLALDPADPTVTLGGTLHGGDPFVVERPLGKGRVVMTSVALDRGGGNLPALQAFVPLVQELVQHLVRLPPAALAVGTAGGPLTLGMDEAARGRRSGVVLEGEGLRGEYFASAAMTRPLLVRLDPAIDFAWGTGQPAPEVPADGFAVRWTGTLLPSVSGTCTFFIQGEGTRLWIDGRPVAAAGDASPAQGTVELVAGRRHAVRIEYLDRTTEAGCRLLWAPGGGEMVAVPSELLSPGPAWLDAAGRLAADAGPLQGMLLGGAEPLPVPLVLAGDALEAELPATGEPGLFLIELPPALEDDFRGAVSSTEIPVAITAAADESRFAQLTAADFAAAGELVPVRPSDTLEETRLAVWGRQGPGGEPLWKPLALAALLLGVAEIALARWIAAQRRLGAVVAADYTSHTSGMAAPRSAAWEAIRAGSRREEALR